MDIFDGIRTTATWTTATKNNAFYTSQMNSQIELTLPARRVVLVARRLGTTIHCATELLLQDSAAKVSCNVAVVAI